MTPAAIGRVEARTVRLAADHATLDADLAIPPHATGIVVFAHGSGSSRLSPRNRQVARALNGAGLATLLLDLLTTAEEAVDRVTREHRFDIPLLATRLSSAVGWVRVYADTAPLPVGLFGASTGAAAALIAAAERPNDVAAVVSRGGRPDLAGAALVAVRAPTLLIVGGADVDVLALNRQAAAAMTCERDVAVVRGATHLFEEPGTMQQVESLAIEWFRTYLGRSLRGHG